MKHIHHPIIISSFLTLIVLCCVYIVSLSPFTQKIGNTINDIFTYKLQYKSNSHNDEIVIIKIDDRTLDSIAKSDLGMIAFDKWVYADAIGNIFSQYGAWVLGIDIVFANPSVLWDEDERKLQQAFDTYKDNIVIASRSDYNPRPLCLYNDVQHGVINTLDQERLREFHTWTFPYDIAPLCPGFDLYDGNRGEISNMPWEVIDIYSKNTDPFTRERIENNLSIFEENTSDIASIAYFSNGRDNIGTLWFESYSFIDIYEGKTQTLDGKQIDLRDKIVLLWEVGTLMHDSHFTPVFQNIKMPGVEINANMIMTLLSGKNIQSIPFSPLIFFIITLCVTLWVIYLRIAYALVILVSSCVFLIFFGAILFTLSFLFNIFLAVAWCLLAFMLAYIYRFQVTDRAKRELKKQFSSYVSPQVVHEISQNPDSVLVAGEKRNMTMFFSDIVSFTTITENNDAEIIVEMLNEYFSEMTKIIYTNSGTLDKYIGDAVMCFFNAPLWQENHSYYACITALQQQKRLRELNKIWKQKNYPEINIRIWIHTWDAIHGNIGSSDTRVNYTVIWDSVNLASRLEGICKMYGMSICVSHDTYELQKESFHFREIDMISVKWRSKPVRIYQLLGEKTSPLSPKHQQYLDRYARALSEYRAGNMSHARELFLQNIWDKASYTMAQRCQDIQEWKSEINQGVFVMLSK